MPSILGPSDTARQLSISFGEGFALAVLAKRTYLVTDDGACSVAAEQIPLVDDIRLSPSHPNLTEEELDLVPMKPMTDVIVMGHAYAGARSARVVSSVRVGQRQKDVLVLGDRRAALSAAGRVVLSEPMPFERMPVSFDRAYGGRDRAAEAKYKNPFMELAPFVDGTDINLENQSPFLYPRNPCGRGFLVEATREAIELVELPNLEDPADLLAPDRFVAGSPERWIDMPIPQAFGWVGWGWFPRLAFTGVWPDFDAGNRPIPEIARGLLSPEVLEELPEDSLELITHEHATRFSNGAPLDMQLPYVTPDASIALSNLHPRKKEWVIHLPGDVPRICTDGRNGRLSATNPVIQSIIIEPDRGLVTLVWRGSAPAIRPYFDDELARMPLLVEWSS